MVQKVVKRYVGASKIPELKAFSVLISLKQEQRIALEDADENERLINQEDMHSFCSQVIKDHYKPFETFVLYMNYLLVAHGNIVSYYNTAEKDWLGHINFCFLRQRESCWWWSQCNYERLLRIHEKQEGP